MINRACPVPALQVTFTIGSENAPWLQKRTYKSLTAAATEVGDSRLYAGLHFPSANADGLKLGRLVGGKVFDKITPKGFVAVRSSDGKGVVAAASGAAAKTTEAAKAKSGRQVPAAKSNSNKPVEKKLANNGRRFKL